MKRNNVFAILVILGCWLLIGQSTNANTWDEAVDGDLSNGVPGTPFALDSGFGVPVSNIVTGVVGGPTPPPPPGGDTADIIAITLAEGCTLDVVLNSYVSAGGSETSAFGVFDEDGNLVVGPVTMGEDQVGTNLVGENDLPPGEYSASVAIVEFTPGQQYVLDYQCTCPVPEPNGLALMGSALLAMVGLRCRKTLG